MLVLCNLNKFMRNLNKLMRTASSILCTFWDPGYTMRSLFPSNCYEIYSCIIYFFCIDLICSLLVHWNYRSCRICKVLNPFRLVQNHYLHRNVGKQKKVIFCHINTATKTITKITKSYIDQIIWWFCWFHTFSKSV